MANKPKQPRTLAPIGDYDVGYCKPPKDYQFKSGEPSANRKGRPRGSANRSKFNPFPAVDLPIHELWLEEAMRPVQVRDGDKVIKLPALQVGYRKTLINAGKGSNPAMRNAHLMNVQSRAQLRAELEECIQTVMLYKEAATTRLNYCKRRAIRFDWDFHPNDVQLDLYTGEVSLAGPKNQEERDVRDAIFSALDFAKEKVKELGEQIRENPQLQRARKRLGLFVLLIDRTNACLPTHYQELLDPEIRELAIIAG